MLYLWNTATNRTSIFLVSRSLYADKDMQTRKQRVVQYCNVVSAIMGEFEKGYLTGVSFSLVSSG